jgi:acetoacetate decarboxylase
VCYVVLSRDLPVVAEAPVIIVVEAPVIVAEVVIVIVAVAYDFQDTQLTGRGVQRFAKL